jgi:hypothetical protein
MQAEEERRAGQKEEYLARRGQTRGEPGLAREERRARKMCRRQVKMERRENGKRRRDADTKKTGEAGAAGGQRRTGE